MRSPLGRGGGGDPSAYHLTDYLMTDRSDSCRSDRLPVCVSSFLMVAVMNFTGFSRVSGPVCFFSLRACSSGNVLQIGQRGFKSLDDIVGKKGEL